jgi:hypothetical protein
MVNRAFYALSVSIVPTPISAVQNFDAALAQLVDIP